MKKYSYENEIKEMKKNIFFEEVNLFNLILALILYFFYGKIIYRTSRILEKNFFINKIIERIFFIRIGYRDVDCKYYNRAIQAKNILRNRFFKNILSKNLIYNNFINENKYSLKQSNKLKNCIWDEFNNDEIHFCIQITSYILLKKNFLLKNRKILYFTHDLSSYLLLNQIKNKNLKVFSILALINLIPNLFNLFFDKIKKFFFIKLFFLKKEKNKSNRKIIIKNRIDLKKASMFNFAFFPHGNTFKYGKSFKKTFIYENNKDSILFKERVLTIWSNEPNELTIRYMKKNKIPYLLISNFLNSKNLIKENIHLIKISLSILINPRRWSINNLIILRTFFVLNRKLTRAKNFFKELKNLNLFYVDYDHLFPKVYLLAADLLGKKSISYQERTLAHLWYPNLIYNYYLVNGKNYENIFKKMQYIVDEYSVVGMHRSKLIKPIKKSSFEYERLNKITKNFKIVLCLPLYKVDKYTTDIIGEDGTSYKSENQFYKDMIKLATKFSSHYFFVKPKIYIKNNFNKNIFNIMMELPNIEIFDNKNITSYEMAYLADLVIGKQSTIMEEILSINKPIIYHDPENNMSSFKFEINKLNLIVKNYDEMESKFLEIIKNNYFLDDKTSIFVNNFFNKENNYAENIDLITHNIKNYYKMNNKI